MTHLNYFFPYIKNNEFHEDHLTRALLVVLRQSNLFLTGFYNYINSKMMHLSPENVKFIQKMPLKNINFETQVGSLPVASNYISLLITNEVILFDQEIEWVERVPIYDGVIDFNGDTVLFIENKLNKNNVWFEQLCPARKDKHEDAELIKSVIIVEWKELISMLHEIFESDYISFSEKIIINDFLEFVNSNFNYLNPFNKLSLCNSSYLAGKRCEQILTEISKLPENVKHHSGWGYYIEINYPEIKKIALCLHYDDNENWEGISIAADFGSTVSQARAFYTKIQSPNIITELEDFDAYCNLHLAFKNQNLVFIHSPENCLENYFNYWKSDVWGNFGGVPKDKLNQNYLFEYADEGILDYNLIKQEEVTENIINKGYTRINICPAIYLEHYLSKEDAIKLDNSGELVSHIKNKITNVLGILEHPLNEIIK